MRMIRPEKATEIRELLRDKRFRKALSIGFDRQRVIDVAWGGIAEAKGMTLSPQSWHFAGPEGQAVYEKWAQADVDFDVDAANAMLDEIGMEKGADGFRTLPSGEPFEMTLDISDWGGSLKVQVDAADEMKKQWETNLGIKVKILNLQGQPDLDTRTNEGYYMLRGAHISEIDILTYPTGCSRSSIATCSHLRVAGSPKVALNVRRPLLRVALNIHAAWNPKLEAQHSSCRICITKPATQAPSRIAIRWFGKPLMWLSMKDPS